MSNDSGKSTLPSDVSACHALIESQATELEKLTAEHEKLRKLLARLANGNKSERRVLHSPSQQLLSFESEEEFEQAKQEAEAKQIIDEHEVKRHTRKKKRRNDSLPAALPRVEVAVEEDDSLKTCPKHGERTRIGEDVQETLVYVPAKVYVGVRRFAMYVCPASA